MYVISTLYKPTSSPPLQASYSSLAVKFCSERTVTRSRSHQNNSTFSKTWVLTRKQAYLGALSHNLFILIDSRQVYYSKWQRFLLRHSIPEASLKAAEKLLSTLSRRFATTADVFVPAVAYPSIMHISPHWL